VPTAFDPYHKWLGIAPDEQPANLYRLLGIKAFENDPDVIESAADQRMAHLRTLGSGKNSELSQKLLNEVSAARVVLLDPQRRADYDRQLRSTISAKAQALPKAAALPRAQPLPAAPLQATPSVAPSLLQVSVSQRTKQPHSLAPPLAIAGGVVALAIVVGVIIALNSGHGPTVAQNENSPPAAAANVKPPSPPPAPPAPKAAAPVATGPATPPPESAGPPKPAEIATPPTAGETPPLPLVPAPPNGAPAPPNGAPEPPAVLPAAAVSPAAARPLVPISPALGKPIDLLAEIDSKMDSHRGKWSFDDQALVVHGSTTDSVLQIPVAAPAEYDLRLAIHRSEEYSMGIGLVAGGKQFPLRFDRVSKTNGIVTELILDGQWTGDSGDPASYRGAVLPRDKTTTLIIKVRRDRLRVLANDELILDWAADYNRCSPQQIWETKDPSRLYLASNTSKFRFTKLELIPLGFGNQAAVAAESGPARPARLPVPDEAAQTQTRKSLNDIYKLAAKKTPAEKQKLAGDLMLLSNDSRDKPAERFVILREAQRLAGEAGDTDLALRAIDALGADFEFDDLLESGRVLFALAAAAKDDPTYARLAELVPPWVARAADADRVDAADKLLDAAVRAVQKPAGRKYAKPIVDLRAAFAEQVKLTRKLEAARLKLAADPTDAEANLTLGYWLCFVQGDWPAGLPLLAKSGDAGLRACAEKELAEPPATAEGQIAIGDAWWDLAQKSPADEKLARLARAADWYRLASAQPVAGLVKARLDQRLGEAREVVAKSPGGEAKAAKTSKSLKAVSAKNGRVLLVMANKEEVATAQKACQTYGLSCDVVKSFDRTRTDYAAYQTIMCGSNDMNYWGKEGNKDPAAFGPLENFVNQGGHLIVCGTFNGDNMQNMQRFGIYTGFVHTSTFERAGAASDLLFAGVPQLVPADNKMQSAGNFDCTRQHVVLLKRGPGGKAGSPALITRQHQLGRVTFNQCEPHWKDDFWLITVLLNWVARGTPTP